MNRLLVSILLSVTCTLAACQKSESDDLAKAQKCLDELPDSPAGYAQALDCKKPIEAYTDQQAKILLCSIYISSGGLMESKIIKGYNILKDSTQTNKSASFMAVLALTEPTVDAGYITAVTANGYCEASGVPGLKYLSNIIVAGSFMAKTLSDLHMTGINPDDPTAVNQAVTGLLAACAPAAPATPQADCATNLGQLGASAESLSTSYCSTSGADPSVCTSINTAVTQAGGNQAALGQALLCSLNGKTFQASDGLCH